MRRAEVRCGEVSEVSVSVSGCWLFGCRRAGDLCELKALLYRQLAARVRGGKINNSDSNASREEQTRSRLTGETKVTTSWRTGDSKRKPIRSGQATAEREGLVDKAAGQWAAGKTGSQTLAAT